MTRRPVGAGREARRNDANAVDRYLTAAGIVAERGTKLTQQLLAFARRTGLEPVGADLSALVNGIADLLDGAVGNKPESTMNRASTSCSPTW